MWFTRMIAIRGTLAPMGRPAIPVWPRPWIQLFRKTKKAIRLNTFFPEPFLLLSVFRVTCTSPTCSWTVLWDTRCGTMSQMLSLCFQKSRNIQATMRFGKLTKITLKLQRLVGSGKIRNFYEAFQSWIQNSKTRNSQIITGTAGTSEQCSKKIVKVIYWTKLVRLLSQTTQRNGTKPYICRRSIWTLVCTASTVTSRRTAMVTDIFMERLLMPLKSTVSIVTAQRTNTQRWRHRDPQRRQVALIWV